MTVGAFDWNTLGDETVEWQRRYLTIDTTNPPGNEAAGARFLADVLSAEGVASEVVEAAPGRANLVARLGGNGSLGGIVLHHHIDVVYADRRYWSVDPFGGVIKDGYLYGRGAIDMKSTGILQLAAVLALKRARVLRGSEKLNVIPPEAIAEIDCRMLAGDDPQEIVDWVRAAVADDRIQVTMVREPKRPNLSPPDNELYKALADSLRTRAPGAVVAPGIMVGFTDNWVFRGLGLHGYGFSPLVLDSGEFQRIHGNDERISLDNVRTGARAYTEMLLAVAAA